MFSPSKPSLLLISLGVLCAMGWTHCASAAEVPASRAIQLVTIDFKPVSWCDKTEVHGYAADIVRQAFAQMSQPVNIRCVPLKRGLEMVRLGQADGFFPAFMTRERRDYADYPTMPLHISPFMIFTRRGEHLPDGYGALQGRTIGINVGNDMGREFDAYRRAGAFKVEEVSSIAQNLYKLASKRVDAIVSNQQATLFAARQMGLQSRIEFQALPESAGRPTYLIFSRASPLPDRDGLYQGLEAALGTMWSDGSIEKILQAYPE